MIASMNLFSRPDLWIIFCNKSIGALMTRTMLSINDPNAAVPACLNIDVHVQRRKEIVFPSSFSTVKYHSEKQSDNDIWPMATTNSDVQKNTINMNQKLSNQKKKVRTLATAKNKGIVVMRIRTHRLRSWKSLVSQMLYQMMFVPQNHQLSTRR